ncbi:MAG: GIY-YIG nuclease family protein [Bacteroidetes bacterium]|jgi:putative endonuclease|nr:GIY-YIG nuclease family protein [Bacteroidota bacterium]
MHFVYLLYSKDFDSFYIGYTKNLEVRLDQHNSGLTKSTKAKKPWVLVYTESFATQLEALKRERFLKSQRNKSFYKRLANI